MKIAFEQSKTYGPEARKFIVIFDMENFSMKQYAYRPAAELVINIFQMYSLNYPEILKYCYVINGESFKAILCFYKLVVYASTFISNVCNKPRPKSPKHR